MTNTAPSQYEEPETKSWLRWAKWLVLAGAIAALVVVAVRITSDDSGGFDTPSHEAPEGSGQFTAEQQQEFAQCMRDQGIDFTDEVGADGEVTMSPGPGVDTNGQAFRDAQAACEAQFVPEGGSPSGGSHGP